MTHAAHVDRELLPSLAQLGPVSFGQAARLGFWSCLRCQAVHLAEPTRCKEWVCGSRSFRFYPGIGEVGR